MYPHTIDDGHGSRMTFLAADAERPPDLQLRRPGRRPADARPPPPVGDRARCSAAASAFRSPASPSRFAGPGEEITFAPGVAHRFWNAGDDRARHDGRGPPAGQHRVLPDPDLRLHRRPRRPSGSLRRRLPADPLPRRVRDHRRSPLPSAASSSRCRRSSAASSAATATSRTPRLRSNAPRALHSPAARPAPVAQLDRASVYGTEGQRFESSRARSAVHRRAPHLQDSRGAPV